MHELIIIPLLTGLLMAPVTSAGFPINEAQPGMWARESAYLWPSDTVLGAYPEGGRDIVVSAPTRTLKVRVRDVEATLLVGDRRPSRRATVAALSLAELLWAPDSTAFALTQSDGGWVGTWYSAVYRVQGSYLVNLDVTKAAMSEFKRTVLSCPDKFPNMVAVAWLQGSKQLLLVGEIPYHSSCADMGKIYGYLVAVPAGSVLARFDKDEICKSWLEKLGPRLSEKCQARDADLPKR